MNHETEIGMFDHIARIVEKRWTQELFDSEEPTTLDLYNTPSEEEKLKTKK